MRRWGGRRGWNYWLEDRWAQGRIEQLLPLAQELAAKRCAVIVTVLGVATAAAAKAAPNTPIVQANGGPPVDLRLAKSLARPGGMVRGVTAIPVEIAEKSLELLLTAAPKIKRVGFLLDPHAQPHSSYLEVAKRTAAYYRVEARFAEARKAEELEPAIARLASEGIQGLVILPSSWFVPVRERLVELVLSHRWPMIYGVTSFADAGALLTYGADRPALVRRAAWQVDRILKGMKLGDLPIEQPTKFELVVNMKTVRLLGLEIPRDLMVRADRIIE